MGKKEQKHVDLAVVESFISFGLCSAECFARKSSYFSHTTYSFYDYHFSYSKSIDILEKKRQILTLILMVSC